MDSEKKITGYVSFSYKKNRKKLQNNKILYIIFCPKFRRLPLKILENNLNNQVLRKKSMQQNWRVHILCCNNTTTIINPKNCVIFFWDNFEELQFKFGDKNLTLYVWGMMGNIYPFIQHCRTIFVFNIYLLLLYLELMQVQGPE